MSDDAARLDQLEQDLRDAAAAVAEPVNVTAGDGADKKGKKNKAPGSNRGIETLFRTSFDVQVGLTSLADTKANIMISINGIIISVIIAAVAPRLGGNPWLLVPTGIFLLGATISIVFAILAARPRIWRPGPEASGGRRNILFFDDFARRSEDDFVREMLELMADRGEVYSAMLRNIHGLGSVLRRKFDMLAIAYRSFMVALVLGVLSAIAVYFVS